MSSCVDAPFISADAYRLACEPTLRLTEMVRSLGTSDARTAKLRACQLYVASENIFSTLNATPMLTDA